MLFRLGERASCPSMGEAPAKRAEGVCALRLKNAHERRNPFLHSLSSCAHGPKARFGQTRVNEKESAPRALGAAGAARSQPPRTSHVGSGVLKISTSTSTV